VSLFVIELKTEPTP